MTLAKIVIRRRPEGKKITVYNDKADARSATRLHVVGVHTFLKRGETDPFLRRMSYYRSRIAVWYKLLRKQTINHRFYFIQVT